MNENQSNSQMFYTMDKIPPFHENLYCHTWAKVLSVEEDFILVSVLHSPYRDSNQEQELYVMHPNSVLSFSVDVDDIVLLAQFRTDPQDQELPYSPVFKLDNAIILDKLSPVSKTIKISVENTFSFQDKDGNSVLTIDIQNKKITIPSGFTLEVDGINMNTHIHEADINPLTSYTTGNVVNGSPAIVISGQSGKPKNSGV